MILALNISLIIVAVIFLIFLLENDLSLFILSIMILIQYIWMFCSISVIENGIFINEQGRDGYFVSSGIILMLFYISTLLALIFYKKLFKSLFKDISSYKLKIKPLKDNNIASIILGMVLFLAYFNLLSSPIPIFDDNVTKFNFWEYARYPFLKPLIGNVMSFVGFGAALLYRVNKKVSFIYLLFYLTYLLLIGQKFTGFFIAIYGVIVALHFSSKNRLRFRLKWFYNKYVLISFIVLFALVYYKYSLKNPFEYLGLTPIESIFYRAFGLQAHVFWGTVEKYIYNSTSHSWNIIELWDGMHVLMREFWPWSYADYISVTSRGVSWTNAYPSILIRIVPLPLALVLNFLLFAIVGCFQSLLTKFIENKSFILSIVFFQLLTWVSYAFTMAYFSKLIIPFFILTLLFLFKYFLLKSQKV